MARAMLRITELKLPLNHADEALAAAIRTRLRITPRDLVRYTIARRAHDARDKADIQLVYSVDVTLRDENAILARFKKDRNVQRTPDTSYRFPVRAPAGWSGLRRDLIGPGPFRLFAG